MNTEKNKIDFFSKTPIKKRDMNTEKNKINFFLKLISIKVI